MRHTKGANLDHHDKTGAARYGHPEAVARLIAAGADVDAQDHDGWNSLSTAVHEGHAEIVRMLLDAGCDVEAREKEGYCTPF